MAYGIIGYSQVNSLNQPSGSIWGDCSSYELKDEGTGYFSYRDWFDENQANLPNLPNATYHTPTYTFDASYAASGTSTPILPALLLTTGSTAAQDPAAIYTKPVVAIAPGSGQKVWFEVALAKESITNVEGVFVGLVNAAGQTAQSSTSNGLIQAVSATKNSNILTGVTLTSLIGFWSHGDALTNFDAVTVNKLSGTGGVTPTTIATNAATSLVLASVLTANANNPNPGNLGYVPATPPGVLSQVGTTTAGSTPSTVKLGLRYDGQQYLYFYVNGAQVAKIVVTSANIDTTSLYGAVVQVSTSTTSAYTLTVPFFRFGALLVP